VRHWDATAGGYDGAKQKNWYYFATLKDLCRRLLPRAGEWHVLEVGCGTGGVLAGLNPARGVGIDISGEMVALARRKYADRANLEFRQGCAEDLSSLGETFDAVIACDVLEHVGDVGSSLRAPMAVLREAGWFLVSTSNPLWAFPLWLLEKMRLKMPEGPHRWVPLRRIVAELEAGGFDVPLAGYQTLIPVAVPRVSDVVNAWLLRHPWINRLGLTEYALARRRAGAAG
jgi:SAM-dependent methyltransferase